MIGGVSFSQVSSVAPSGGALNTSASPPVALQDPDWSTISRSGEILNKLQQLATSDPAKLQAALTRMAGDLSASAQDATGSRADALGDVASRFAQAATSGDLSSLAQGSGHHHHGRPAIAVNVPSAAASGTSTGAGAGGSGPTDPGTQAVLAHALAQLDEAMGMNPPPFGPWFTE